MGLSAIDFLTGILNRRAFQKSVEDEMYKKTPGVFIFIDVDNFKSYNDTYGHNNGDFCLKHFAETMKKCFPAESIIGRYGGDEFVVYLKNLTVEEVQTELQKMNLPRRLDQKTLENLMRTLRRYNLARPVGRLSGLDSRIEVFPTVLLALPDADLADAAAESARTRTELGLYERPEEAGEAEE